MFNLYCRELNAQREMSSDSFGAFSAVCASAWSMPAYAPSITARHVGETFAESAAIDHVLWARGAHRIFKIGQ
jgi:hypothetical protein